MRNNIDPSNPVERWKSWREYHDRLPEDAEKLIAALIERVEHAENRQDELRRLGDSAQAIIDHYQANVVPGLCRQRDAAVAVLREALSNELGPFSTRYSKLHHGVISALAALGAEEEAHG